MKLELIQGDITKIEADAIVNAANTSLMGGRDGAITTVREFSEKNSKIEKVIFVCFDRENYHLYKSLL